MKIRKQELSEKLQKNWNPTKLLLFISELTQFVKCYYLEKKLTISENPEWQRVEFFFFHAWNDLFNAKTRKITRTVKMKTLRQEKKNLPFYLYKNFEFIYLQVFCFICFQLWITSVFIYVYILHAVCNSSRPGERTQIPAT